MPRFVKLEHNGNYEKRSSVTQKKESTCMFETVTAIDTPPKFRSEAYLTEHAQSMGIERLYRAGFLIGYNKSISALIDDLEQIVGRKAIQTIPVLLDFWIKFEKLIVVVDFIKAYDDHRNLTSLGITLFGDIEEVELLIDKIREAHPLIKSNQIEWFYANGGGMNSKTVSLPRSHTPDDSFYPWIKQGIASYQKEFLKSDANVLLLMGDPGNGKTSFCRDLIHRNNLSAVVTYDEDLMQMDQFFSTFISSDYDAMIIEDADVLIGERKTGNKVMSKLLNASDGLVKTKKKLIFTTNLTQISQVDEALIRPGRCFDTMMFRELTHREACIAAKAAGVGEPDDACTLAQLFSKGPSINQSSRMGFYMP